MCFQNEAKKHELADLLSNFADVVGINTTKSDKSKLKQIVNGPVFL